jgi:hypothetical protein
MIVAGLVYVGVMRHRARTVTLALAVRQITAPPGNAVVPARGDPRPGNITAIVRVAWINGRMAARTVCLRVHEPDLNEHFLKMSCKQV